jgi:hypothetical protein
MRLVVIESGVIAGLVATAALSAIMLMKQSMGLMPEFDLIAVITVMAGAGSPVVGWIGHFVIGTVFWEVAFAIVSPYLTFPSDRGSAVQSSPRPLPRRSIVVMSIPGPACLGGVSA